MEALYFYKDSIKELEENNMFEKFFDYWDVNKFFGGHTFMREGKKYKLSSIHTTPCVLMKCLDDESILSFGVDSEIKNEFVLVE